MRFFLARIFYVVFGIGGMVGLGMLWKYAVISMSSDMQTGFIAGALFVAAIVAGGFWVDKREREGRSQ